MNFDLLQRFGPQLLHGLLVTLELVSISIVAGAILAIPITAARLSSNRDRGGARDWPTRPSSAARRCWRRST